MGLTKPRAAQIYDIDYKQATRVVTVTNITLSGGAPSTVDGVNLSLNDRVLVTGQSTSSQNGVYYVSTLGSGSNGTWTRTTDTNETGELLGGTIIMVTEGTIYADTQWKLTTNDPITIGTTSLTFVQNYSANSISGGTSNVVVYGNGNVIVSSAGTANVLLVSSTGTIVTGTESVTGNITGANLLTAGLVSATGNLTGNYLNANIYYATGFSASKIFSGNTEVNVVSSGGNVNVSIGGTSNVAVFSTTGEYVTGLVSASGNVTGGNLTTSGTVSTTGNVNANYLNANIYYATGFSASRIFNGNSEVNVVSGGGNVNVSVGGTSNVVVWSTAGEYVTGLQSVTGNIQGGNLRTTGLISATGNVTGGYLLGNAALVSGVNAFSTIAVSGQNTIIANSIASTLTFAAGNNIVITTSNTSGIVTIAYSSGGGGTSIFSTGGDMGLVTASVTSSEDLGLVTDVASISYDLGQLGVTGVVSGSDIIANTITGNNLTNNIVITTTGNLTAANLALTSSTTDVRGWAYNTQVTIADKEQSPTGVALNSAGTKMYFIGTTNKTAYQFTVATPYNISTATYSSLSFSVVSQDAVPQDIRINSAGTTMWVLGGASAKIFQYSISSGDVSTASYGNINLSVSAQEPTPTGFTLTPDGANAYVIGSTNKTVYQYTLSSPGNVATGTYALKSFSVTSQDSAPTAVQFNAAGTAMWVLGDTNNCVYQYTLSDPFNVTTATYYAKFYIGDQESSPHGLYVDITGGGAYMIGQAQDIVYQYSTGNSTIATSNSLFHTSSTIQLAGNIYAAGNITGSYFIGNGAAITGITSTPPPALNINLQQNYGGF